MKRQALDKKQRETLLLVKTINEIAYKHTLYGEPVEVEYTEPWEVYQSIYNDDANEAIEILKDILELARFGYVQTSYNENDLQDEFFAYDFEFIKVDVISKYQRENFITANDMRRLAEQIIKEHTLNEKSTYTEIVYLIKTYLYKIENTLYEVLSDDQFQATAFSILEKLGATCMGYICKYLFKKAFRLLTMQG